MVYDFIEMVRVHSVEVGGYGLGMSDGMWWCYIKNSEDICRYQDIERVYGIQYDIMGK